MLRVWSAHQETCRGYIDGAGVGEGESKGAEVGKNTLNNQQGLEAAMAMEGSGGVAGMGGNHDQ